MAPPVMHVAAPIGADHIQRCARCRVALKDLRLWGEIDPFVGPLAFQGGMVYPDGAIVAVGDGWQAMALGNEVPTCEPRTTPTTP